MMYETVGAWLAAHSALGGFSNNDFFMLGLPSPPPAMLSRQKLWCKGIVVYPSDSNLLATF